MTAEIWGCLAVVTLINFFSLRAACLLDARVRTIRHPFFFPEGFALLPSLHSMVLNPKWWSVWTENQLQQRILVIGMIRGIYRLESTKEVA